MRPDETYVHPTQVISDMGNQPVSVPLDVEHHPIVRQETRRRISCLDILRMGPLRVKRFRIPRPQRLLGIGVFAPEILERFPGDDTHKGRIPCSLFGSKPLWMVQLRFQDDGTREWRGGYLWIVGTLPSIFRDIPLDDPDLLVGQAVQFVNELVDLAVGGKESGNNFPAL